MASEDNRSLPSPLAGISLWGRADLPSLWPHSSWTTADRVFLCWLRLSVRLATVVGRILVSNVALFLVRREGLRRILRSCPNFYANKKPPTVAGAKRVGALTGARVGRIGTASVRW